MDTDIRLSFNKKRLLKNKKRVVTTLFLYLLLFILACDFKKPEQWEMPGLYTSMTVALVNSEYSFGGLVDSNTILSNDSNVIRLEYPVDIDTIGIEDKYFDIDMSSVQITIPDLGSLGDPIEIPEFSITLNESIDFETEISESLTDKQRI